MSDESLASCQWQQTYSTKCLEYKKSRESSQKVQVQPVQVQAKLYEKPPEQQSAGGAGEVVRKAPGSRFAKYQLPMEN